MHTASLVVQGRAKICRPKSAGGSYLQWVHLSSAKQRRQIRGNPSNHIHDFHLPLQKFSTPRAKKESGPLLAGKFLPSPGHGTAPQFPSPRIFSQLQGGEGGFSWRAWFRNPPRPPLKKGGQKSPAVNSCNDMLERFFSNNSLATEALTGEYFCTC